MKKYNIISSIVGLILALAMYLFAGTFPVKAGRLSVLNPGFYPKLLAVILAVLALLLLISSLRKPETVQKKFWEGIGKKPAMILGMTLVLLILFPILLQLVGFPITTFLFILTLTYVLSDKTKYSVLSIVLVALANTTVIYLVFKLFLRIPFPRGSFFGY